MLRVRRRVLLFAAFAMVVLAGCGSGGGHSTRKTTARPPTPETEEFRPAPKKPVHHHGPILAGAIRPILGGSGEGAWAPGRKIYLTADDGRTWRAVAPVDVHGFVGSDFIDADHGWVVAETSYRHPHLAIYATTDGGFTWTKGVVQHPRQFSILSVPLSFVDRRVGYALVDPMHGSGVEVGGTLYRTGDGGAHWDRAGETPVDGVVDFTGPRHGWLVGGLTKTLWHTDDGGRHWRRVRVDPPPGVSQRKLRYGMPARVSGGLEVLPVLLEGSPTRIAFYERAPSGWKPAYVDTLMGELDGGVEGSVSDRPSDGFVVSDPGVHALKLIRFDRAGLASARVLPARGMPSGAFVRFADVRHGFATPCEGCEHPGTQPYVTTDGGRTWARRPFRLRRSAALEALPRCAPTKLLVYQSDKGGAALGTVYTSLTIENLSGRACKYSGTPRVIAVGIGGRTIGREAARNTRPRSTPGHPHHTVILLPNGTATVQLSYGEAYNVSPKDCGMVTAPGLLVTLPGAHRPQRIPMPFARCSKQQKPGIDVGRIE